jgi:hypothetical protein
VADARLTPPELMLPTTLWRGRRAAVARASPRRRRGLLLRAAGTQAAQVLPVILRVVVEGIQVVALPIRAVAAAAAPVVEGDRTVRGAHYFSVWNVC